MIGRTVEQQWVPPEQVVRLLRRIATVMGVEVLLTLFVSGETLTPAALVRRLGGPVRQVRNCLDTLEAAGLVTAEAGPEPGYVYRPTPDEPALVILAGLYASRRPHIVACLVGDQP